MSYKLDITLIESLYYQKLLLIDPILLIISQSFSSEQQLELSLMVHLHEQEHQHIYEA